MTTGRGAECGRAERRDGGGGGGGGSFVCAACCLLGVLETTSAPSRASARCYWYARPSS